MRCTRLEKFLPLHVAGDLAGRRARAVAAHLRACAACRRTADEYRASRELLRAAVMLPPDFGDAFYDDLRASVLARISRDDRRRFAPPPSARFARFFNARFAYAASLALIVICAAALSLHTLLSGASTTDEQRQKMIANTNGTFNAPPRARPTSHATQAVNDGRQTSPRNNERARMMTPGGEGAAKRPLPKRRAGAYNSQNAAPQRVTVVKRLPSPVRRNPLAPSAIITGPPRTVEMAMSGRDGTAAQPEVSRIEIQTSDPNIRIIWLSPGAGDATQPLR